MRHPIAELAPTWTVSLTEQCPILADRTAQRIAVQYVIVGGIATLAFLIEQHIHPISVYLSSCDVLEVLCNQVKATA